MPAAVDIACAPSGVADPLAALITASSENPPYEGKDKAFDGDKQSKWLAWSNTGWIAHCFDEPKTVSHYRLTSANDAPARDPRNWRLLGSNDGQNWTQVDARSNQTFASRHLTLDFALPAPATYRRFKLEVDSNNGDRLLQLAEIALRDAAAPATWEAPAVAVTFPVSADAETEGGRLFKRLLPAPEARVRKLAIDVARTLYRDPVDSRRATVIRFEIREKDPSGGDFVAYASGSGGQRTIAMSTAHMANVYRQSGNSDQALLDEIEGVLVHEITHVYQNEPEGAGGYAGGTPYWAFIEGMADAVRAARGYKAERTPSTLDSNKWLGGYDTTAFFLDYLTKAHDQDFLFKFNATAATIKPWSFDKALLETVGRDAATLWGEYERHIALYRFAHTVSQTSHALSRQCLRARADCGSTEFTVDGKRLQFVHDFVDAGDALGDRQIDVAVAPSAAGFTAALDSPAEHLFRKNGAPVPANCAVSYRQATAAGVAPVISLKIAGCQ